MVGTNFFLNDFFNGIKENFFKTFIYFLVISLSIYGLYSLKLFSNLSWFIKYVPFGVFLCMIFAAFLHYVVIINIYTQPLGKTIKNSFVMYFKSPFLTLLFTCLPFLILYLIGKINLLTIKILVLSIIIVILLPSYLLLWNIYEISILDKYVNKKYFPEAYRKGLNNKEERNNQVENNS